LRPFEKLDALDYQLCDDGLEPLVARGHACIGDWNRAEEGEQFSIVPIVSGWVLLKGRFESVDSFVF